MLALDTASIKQSHKHPTLCTVTVNGYKELHTGAPPTSHHPDYHWKLPTADPREERNLPLHLHTLDIYFWTAQDATSFISSAQRLLQAGQLELLDFPLTSAIHEQSMSSVVQQLENAAIQDPAYRNSRAQESRTSSILQSQPSGSNLGQGADAIVPPKAEDLTAFTPLAYNPAAPAAPEPIAHREKTPPPVDSEEGTGLASAAAADHMQTTSPHNSSSRPGFGIPHASSGYVGGSPLSPFGGAYVGSPPSATGPRTSSITSFATPSNQSGRTSANPQPSFAPPPAQGLHSGGSPSDEQLSRLNSPKQQPPLDSPAAEILGNSYVGGHHQPLQHVQPHYPDYLASGHQAEAPVGGYSDFKYTSMSEPQQQQPQASEYDIHSQVYRPTEDEFTKKKPGKAQDPGGQQNATGRLEDRAGKVDKGVNRFFKKLEKKIG